MQRLRILGLAACLSATSTSYSFAQSEPSFWIDARFEPAPPHYGSSFGAACATALGYTVVGVPFMDNDGLDSGGAYVFHREPWTSNVQVLQPSTPVDSARVGGSVAMDLGRIVLGAAGEHEVFDGAGAVYVFERFDQTWMQRARLVAPNPTSHAQFGTAVAISGAEILVGACGGDGAATRSGVAYLFHLGGSGWSLAHTFTAPDGSSDQQFGSSVALQGDTAVVGAVFASAQSSPSGAAYVFTRSGTTWSGVTKLFPPSGPTSIEFGRAVALGNLLAISESSDAASPAHPGAVHVWLSNGAAWVYETRIQPAEVANSDRFGISIALAGDRLVVGAPGQAAAQPGAGAAYVFTHNGSTWPQIAKFTAPDGAAQDGFGSSVAFDSALVITAPGADSAGAPNAGAAYRYAVSEVALVGVPYCRGDASAGDCPCGNFSPSLPPAGCENSRGVGAVLRAIGSASVSWNNFQFNGSRLAPNRIACLIGSLASPHHGVGRPFANGLLCLGSPRVLLGTRHVDASGTVDWNYVLGAPELHGGETWHFQVWYRDDATTACGYGSNFSNALEIELLP